MKKVGLILGIAILGLAAAAGWQVGSCELTNTEFRDDLHDLAAQNGARIGLVAPNSDEDLRDTIIQIAAQRYGIHLDPEQVTVQRSGTDEAPKFYFAVDYQAKAGLPGFPFTLHFTPTSK
ncbi:MAG TPA: hypothetical protein VHX36_06280 [Candidatus Acidoferrales bacterium]|jgi:hypothetical protein|nr:hypothetical protein [Candidatus Acidoferrales bacterium]